MEDSWLDKESQTSLQRLLPRLAFRFKDQVDPDEC